VSGKVPAPGDKIDLGGYRFEVLEAHHVSGKVPAPGDKIDLGGYRFEVLEANQRKVLRLRIRKPVGTSAKATS